MFQLKIPNNLESIIDVKITTIYKKIGDLIQEGEIFCDIETDKVSIEITSPVAGVLDSIFIKEQTIIAKDDILALINQDTPKIKSKKSNNFKTNKKINTTSYSLNNESDVFSPNSYQKSLPQDSNSYFLNSANTVKLDDVLNSLNYSSHQNSQHLANIPFDNLTVLKKASIKKLKTSQLVSVSTTTYNEIIMDNLIDYRENIQKVSFNTFFIKAISIALIKFPILNAQLINDKIYHHPHHNISVAIASNYGLVTPVINSIETQNLQSIDKTIQDLAQKANNKALTLAELSNGTFTLTNGGVYGSMLSNPILNSPQSAILGLHKIQKRPIVITKNNQDSIEICSHMYIALTYDHRLIDGKDAVSFLSYLKSIIENPKDIFKQFDN